MPLTIDLAAVQHNAAVIARLCRSAGVDPVAVIKEAYAAPALIDAILQGGMVHFAASSARAALRVRDTTGRPCMLLGLLAPAFPATALAACNGSLHRHLDTAQRAQALASDHAIWIDVATSDGRGGVSLAAALKAAVSWRLQPSPGLLFNWGCLAGPPPVSELTAIGPLLAERPDMPIPLSLGGSALLPQLAMIAGLAPRPQLRIGEALLTGTIPGGTGADLGLRSPATLDGRVVDVEYGTRATRRILINRGRTTLNPDDFHVAGLTGRAIEASSELTIFELGSDDRDVSRGELLELRPGYSSTVRSLLNRTMKVHWKR